jgi:hypothetical protein
MKRSQSPSHYSASDILYNAERNKGNMDVFKLAFETTIVGVLAFLWIGIAIDLLLPSLLPRMVAAVTEKNQTLVGVGVLSLAYCLGSATLPISSQLVNDEHWPLPEDAIRCWVSIAQESQYAKIGYAELPKQYIPLSDDLLACRCTLWDRLMPVDPKTGKRGLELSLSELRRNDDAKKQRILTMFQLREAKVMNQSPEKTERIRQLHERIVVLRGAVLHAYVLLLIGFFGCMAPVEGQPCSQRRKKWGILLALVLTVVAVFTGLADLLHPSVYDMPVLEALVGAVTIFGGFLVFNGIKSRSILSWQFLVVVGFFAALCYGGWMWSEIIYDQQVINSFALLQV